jgi:predicted TIM-barrel fold metal-dependent hydrolase
MFPALIDCDVHEDVPGPEAVLPYLSEAWREFASLAGVMLAEGTTSFSMNPWGYHRKDSVPPDGGAPGSSLEFVVEQLVDPCGITYAVLTGDWMSLYLGALANPHLGRETARALNDYRAEHWLRVDDRFLGSICVPVQVPDWAAQEVLDRADDPGFVQVILSSNPHSFAFGHPMFDPLHRALAETGRAVGIHSLGQSAASAGPAHLAGGQPTYYTEFHGGGTQEMMTQAMSFIYNGVFERYPSLKLVLIEAGSVGWVAPFLKRLDMDFKGLRREVPWCKKLPSEYFASNIRVTTQPFDHDVADDHMLMALDEYGAEDFLLFATDYPHWDADVPLRALSAMPRSWREKVAYRNAAELYGLKVPVPA